MGRVYILQCMLFTKRLANMIYSSDPDTDTNSGTDFAIGFFGNVPANPSQAAAVLYIGTNDPEGAQVTI